MRARVAWCFALGLVVVPAAGAQSRRNCPPVQVDSTVSDSAGVLPPTYLECHVERVARLRGHQPRVQWLPQPGETFDGGCFRAEFEFVVDSAGRVERESIRLVYSTNPAYAEAVRETIDGLTYQPARLKGKLVRQVVQYHQTAQVRVRLTTSPVGGVPGAARSMPAQPAAC